VANFAAPHFAMDPVVHAFLTSPTIGIGIPEMIKEVPGKRHVARSGHAMHDHDRRHA